MKILQFGEGNFLRAFVDYMVDYANKHNGFDGQVIIAKAISQGNLAPFHERNFRYTLVTRGLMNGEQIDTTEQIDSVKDAVCVYEEYDKFLSLARDGELSLVVSNTTEAGIVYSESDQLADRPPQSYPSKLTVFLHERFRHFQGAADKGLYILPCELIENNGSELEKCVLQTAENWQLSAEFITWIKTACIFCNTLVDRIVTGFDKNLSEQYGDPLIDVCEPFALWVIEDKKNIREVLPLGKAGLPVVFTDQVAAFRERKVRILNGAHTATVLAGYLCGKKIVRDCMADPLLSGLMNRCLHDEIIPTIDLDKNDLNQFANAVLERFANPFIDHSVLSISLNSISKWKARLLGSFKDYVRLFGKIPTNITFSFSALLAFYMSAAINGAEPYEINDNDSVLAVFSSLNEKYIAGSVTLAEYVKTIASHTDFWGEDLTVYPGFEQTVCRYLEDILSTGTENALQNLEKETTSL